MTRRPFLHSLLLLALLPVAAFAAGASAAAEPVAGTDYEVIEGGQPFAAAKGKIEVVEVFGYTCQLCADFAPKIEAWKRTLPADVTLTYLPRRAATTDPLAIAFFAAQTTGALAKTHAAMFRALHEAHSLPRNPTVDEIATFYGQLGVDEGKLRNAMLAASTVARLAPARQFIHRQRRRRHADPGHQRQVPGDRAQPRRHPAHRRPADRARTRQRNALTAPMELPTGRAGRYPCVNAPCRCRPPSRTGPRPYPALCGEHDP